MDRIIERKCVICKREFLKRAYIRDRGKVVRTNKANKWGRVIRPKMSYNCSKECSNKYINAITWYRQRGSKLIKNKK